MEISFAACGFSSQTVLVISIEKRWHPMLIITRPCFVAIGAACCGCSGKGVGLVGIVVPLAGIGSPTSMSLLGHSCQLPLSSAAGAQNVLDFDSAFRVSIYLVARPKIRDIGRRLLYPA